MWGYITSLSGSLTSATQYCSSNPENAKQLLKKSPGRRYITFFYLLFAVVFNVVNSNSENGDSEKGF